MKKIAVIGAGLGGMAVAAKLAHHGYQVDVFEKNSKAGGKAGQIQKDGFRFDTGPSVLTMPFVFENFFQSIGLDTNDYLEFIPLDISTRYFFNNGSYIDAHHDFEEFSKEVMGKTKDSKEQLKKYMDYCKKIYDFGADLFLFSNFRSFKELAQKANPKMLFQLHRLDAFRSVHQANKKFFKDDKLLKIFNRFSTYNGSNPYQAPATLNIIPHVELGLGSYTVKGGIYQISKALQQACHSKGVQFHFDSKVEKIITHKKSAKGIVVNGQESNCHKVISNNDVVLSYEELLNKKKSRIKKRYEKLGLSSSAVVFYWGIRGNYPELQVNNIFFSDNYRQEFKEIFDDKIVSDDPTIYIHISSKINRTDAPQGHENWFVMINGTYDSGQNWSKEVPRLKKIVISRLEAEGIHIGDKIITESILTPPLLEEKTSSYRGALYGVSSNSRISAFLRHPNRSKKFKNLYFVGGSVHPGGGMPLVILSANIAANEILRSKRS